LRNCHKRGKERKRKIRKLIKNLGRKEKNHQKQKKSKKKLRAQKRKKSFRFVGSSLKNSFWHEERAKEKRKEREAIFAFGKSFLFVFLARRHFF